MTTASPTFCSSCGAHLDPAAHFCPVCGTSRTPGTPGPAPTAPYGAPAAPVGAPRRSPAAIIGVVAAIVVVVALVAGAVVFLGGDDEASASEVTLEPVSVPTPDPFTDSVAGDESAASGADARIAPAGGTAAGGEQLPGSTPGLYGGTRNAAVCDADQLVAFLEANPDKAEAWAGVVGTTPEGIGAYVATLTPVVLTRDTRVTNHGYRNGKATTIPAVLQAGTAVLVDRFGVPRVKCGCGNPLSEPAPVTSATRYVGTRWAGFSETTIVVVTVTVQVEVFVLVDVDTDGLYTRPPGSDGSDDGDLAVDELCDLFPDDPACVEESTTTTTTTAPPETLPPATAPPVTHTPQTQPPTTGDDPDSGDRSNEALGWINDAMVACDPTTGEYVTDMSAWGSGTSYTVTVTISLDSGSWVATFYVDFATEDWPEITPADSESAALICQ